MEKILCDFFCKDKAPVYGEDPTTDFNVRVSAINSLYSWLFEKGILKATAFIIKDCQTVCSFAVDLDALLPYRDKMLASGILDFELAVQMLFEEEHTPCMYSGAIQLLYPMQGFRSNRGCVQSVWECSLTKFLNQEDCDSIAQIRRQNGVKRAVNALFDKFIWKTIN